MNFHIRLVQATDIAQLQASCWPAFAPAYTEDLVKRALLLYDKQRGGGFVALADEVVVGFGMLNIWASIGEISDLIVYEPFRGKGIGSCLIAQMCSLALDFGLVDIEIGAFSDNIDALRLYEHLGFVRHRTLIVQSGKSPQIIIYLYKQLSKQR